jgi:serine O-acetyltransferase
VLQSTSSKLQTLDPIWAAMRSEAEAAMAAEPALGSFIFATVLSHQKLEEAVCH